MIIIIWSIREIWKMIFLIFWIKIRTIQENSISKKNHFLIPLQPETSNNHYRIPYRNIPPPNLIPSSLNHRKLISVISIQLRRLIITLIKNKNQRSLSLCLFIVPRITTKIIIKILLKCLLLSLKKRVIGHCLSSRNLNRLRVSLD